MRRREPRLSNEKNIEGGEVVREGSFEKERKKGKNVRS
jgi:hypothetical protein